MNKHDELRRKKDRNSTLTGAKPRDRVGGGMQRSAPQVPSTDDADDVWEPGTDCDQDFHFVRFLNGKIEIACDCLTAWYND